MSASTKQQDQPRHGVWRVGDRATLLKTVDHLNPFTGELIVEIGAGSNVTVIKVPENNPSYVRVRDYLGHEADVWKEHLGEWSKQLDFGDVEGGLKP